MFAAAEHAVAMRASDKVALSEWQRFLLTDPSALAPLYEQVNFESMRYIPLLHCAKFLLLIPPLLLEPNSLAQIASSRPARSRTPSSSLFFRRTSRCG
jgi:hypothetical protein